MKVECKKKSTHCFTKVEFLLLLAKQMISKRLWEEPMKRWQRLVLIHLGPAVSWQHYLFVGWLFWREALKDLVRLECCHSVLRRESANRGICIFCEEFWFLSFLICFLRTFGEKLSGCLSTWYCCMFGSLPTCWWIKDNGSTPCGELKKHCTARRICRFEHALPPRHWPQGQGAARRYEGDKSFGRT